MSSNPTCASRRGLQQLPQVCLRRCQVARPQLHRCQARQQPARAAAARLLLVEGLLVCERADRKASSQSGAS